MKSFGKELRNSFFAGLLVVGPVAASIGVLWIIFETVTNWLLPEKLQSFMWRVVALVVFALLVTAIGWVTRLVAGRRLLKMAESMIRNVPLLNRIYGFMKEVSDTLLGGKKTAFERVVLVPHPRQGMYMVGLVTSEAGGEHRVKTKSDLLNVFVPASPPAHGFLVMVPRDQLIDLDMSVADGMKMVLSGGAVVPPMSREPTTAVPGPLPPV